MPDFQYDTIGIDFLMHLSVCILIYLYCIVLMYIKKNKKKTIRNLKGQQKSVVLNCSE